MAVLQKGTDIKPLTESATGGYIHYITAAPLRIRLVLAFLRIWSRNLCLYVWCGQCDFRVIFCFSLSFTSSDRMRTAEYKYLRFSFSKCYNWVKKVRNIATISFWKYAKFSNSLFGYASENISSYSVCKTESRNFNSNTTSKCVKCTGYETISQAYLVFFTNDRGKYFISFDSS